MTEDVCKDCGMLMPPQKTTCPVCGFDNRFADTTKEIDPELIASLTDQMVPSNTQGY